MNDVMTKITDEVIGDIQDKEIKQIIIEQREPRTIEQDILVESIKKVGNPFAMVSLKYVMKDLGISQPRAYALFREADFPSVKIGKEYKVMFLAYVLWKLKTKGGVI